LERHGVSEKGFNGIIFECIDRALSALGEASKQALYYQVTMKSGLKSDELQFKPLEVLKYLRLILGDVGYTFIEKLIVREIRMNFNLTPANVFDLQEVISQARKKFLARK
jgi:hypothetical protein